MTDIVRKDSFTFLTTLSVVASLIVEKNPTIEIEYQSIYYVITEPVALSIIAILLRSVASFTLLACIFGSLASMGFVTWYDTRHIDIISPTILFLIGIVFYLVTTLICSTRVYFQSSKLVATDSNDLEIYELQYYLASIIPILVVFFVYPFYIFMIRNYTLNGRWL